MNKNNNNQCFDQHKPSPTTKKRHILDCVFGERTDLDVEVGEQQRVYKTTVDDCCPRRRWNNCLPFSKQGTNSHQKTDKPLLKSNNQTRCLRRRLRKVARTKPLRVSPTKPKTKVPQRETTADALRDRWGDDAKKSLIAPPLLKLHLEPSGGGGMKVWIWG